MFTNEHFHYERKHIPVLFNDPTPQEKCLWEGMLLRITRDFFKQTRTSTLQHDPELILGSGLTFGEFAMFLVWSSWAKRMQKS